ncbi:hypothetical protein ABZT04_32410 [Streptomyces sp. NPDC005492]|uniref:hypothetical protein n=1 Tax=Streptomyces sp. NPDC005492 TaxID=3156883 RepID=UPI0033B3A70C
MPSPASGAWPVIPFAVAQSPLSAGGTGMSRAQCAALLVRAHDWLERAVAQVSGVNGLAPLVTQAVDLYRRGEYDQCLRLVGGVRQAIELARATLPSLPAW